MTDRKKKPQADDNAPTTFGNNFANFFLTLCEKYDVSPLPKIVPVGNFVVPPETSGRKSEIVETAAPIIRICPENSKVSENNWKIECRGYEISVCILDALILSIKTFDAINTIRLPNCGINAFGISQIAQIITESKSVKDLNLDLNPNIRENYHLLCTPFAKLQYLSLKYCNISDGGVEKIAKELSYKGVKESSQLIGLNLANNCIGDVGAGHIARMLRTNRSLQSLVLTGNRIEDFGTALIIQELSINFLNHEEIVDLRRSNYSRLMQRKSFNRIDDFVSQRRENSSTKIKSKTSRRSLSSRKNTISKQSLKKLPSDVNHAETIDENLINDESTNFHPFSRESRPIDGKIVTRGNFELQHLNLAYNHLTEKSLKKFIECLSYQNYMLNENTSEGLLYVSLEGNDFETEDNEDWNEFHDLLDKRRSSKFTSDDFENFASNEIRILREKLRASE